MWCLMSFIHLLRLVCSWQLSLSWIQRRNWASLSYSSCGKTATRQELPHFILMILKFCFEIYILQNIQPWWISSSDMLNWPPWTPVVLDFHLDPVRTQTSETVIGVAFLRPTNSPISLLFPCPSKISQHPYSAWRSYEESLSQFPRLWGWRWLF